MRGLLDSHCHLDDPRYTDLDGVERRRLRSGVRVLVPGVNPLKATTLGTEAARRGWLYAVGLHPERARPDWRDQLGSGPEPVMGVGSVAAGASAIGECGLHRPGALPMVEQVALLRAHLDAAARRGLPVILHCVRAHDVLPAILREFAGTRPGRAPFRGVLHSYSGGAGLVPVYEGLGLHLSFGGAITWPDARRPVASLRAVRADRLLLESDGPDQRPHLPPEATPSDFGPWSEPAMLPVIAGMAAALRGVPLAELLDQLDANAQRLGW